jgi:hemerythrin-like domain-containing protein
MMTVETQDPLDELERENDVAEKLIERLAETAIELKEGRNPPPGEIAEGLRLLEQYRKVHAVRIDRDLQPEARAVAMATCFQHLDAITDDHRIERDQIDRVRTALKDFASDPDGSRTRLSQALADLTQKDHESMAYEEDYPLSCLRAALPDEAAARVNTAFHETVSEVADLEGHIEQYLGQAPGTPGHALTVRCNQENCSATAESHVVPSSDGRLGIEVPAGWQVDSVPPVFGDDGTIRLRADFWCRDHREKSAAKEGVAVVVRRDGGAVASRGAEMEGTEPCGCCGPIPADSR